MLLEFFVIQSKNYLIVKAHNVLYHIYNYMGR